MARKTKSEKNDAKPARKTKAAGTATGGKRRSKSKTAARAAAVTHEAIAARAYEIYLARGAAPGGAEQDWAQAEAELLQKA